VSEVTVRPVDAAGAVARRDPAGRTAADSTTRIAGRFTVKTAAGAALVAATLVWLFLWFAVQTAGAAPAAPVEVWHADYAGPSALSDGFNSVITAGNGDVVVAGYGTANRRRGTDVLLARYSAGGARRWVRLWDGPAGGDDHAKTVVADGTGGFYVVGRIAGRGHDLLVMRYSSTGVLRWYRRYDAGDSRYDEGRFAITDSAHNVYVVGVSTLQKRFTWRIVKYSKDGRQLWTSSFGSGYEAEPTDVATDGAGQLFVTGTYATRTRRWGATRAYSSRGRLLWEKKYNWATSTRPAGIAYAPDGLYLAISKETIDYEPVSAQIVKQSPTTGDQIWSAGWTTVPDGQPYAFLDVAVLPGYGAVAVGHYWAFPPTNVAGLFGVDANGLNETSASWWDPLKVDDSAMDTGNRRVVTDGSDGVWSLGYRFDNLIVSRFSPSAGASSLFMYVRGDLITDGRALAAQGGALYVAGHIEHDDGTTQGLLLKVQ
jgi:hypothetical protein